MSFCVKLSNCNKTSLPGTNLLFGKFVHGHYTCMKPENKILRKAQEKEQNLLFSKFANRINMFVRPEGKAFCLTLWHDILMTQQMLSSKEQPGICDYCCLAVLPEF